MPDARKVAWGQAHRKYVWTDALRDELRLAYAHRKNGITAALDKLERRTGWPRHAFTYEARRLGLITADHRRGWTAAEEEYVRERAGSVSPAAIARSLGRSIESVECKINRLGLSRRISEGHYSMNDLQEVLGESLHKVRRWMDRGLLGKVHEVSGGKRVRTENVMRFLRRHCHEYDLRRVDQLWYKSMLFGEGGPL